MSAVNKPHHTGDAALMRLPRELRDMIYAEAGTHRCKGKPQGPLLNIHHYWLRHNPADPEARGNLHIYHVDSDLIKHGPVTADNMIDFNVRATLLTVCRQMRDEILDMTAKKKRDMAQLEITCEGRNCAPFWTYLPLLGHPLSPIDVNVTLRLRTYDAIRDVESLLAPLLGSLIHEHDPISRRPRLIDSVPKAVRVMHIRPECHDPYLPAQFDEMMRKFQIYCTALDFFRLSADILAIGTNLRIHTTVRKHPHYWYTGNGPIPVEELEHYGDAVRTRPDWEVDDFVQES